MKKILFILSAILFSLLLGTGLQYLIVGMFTLTVPQFDSYTVWNWIFQIIYWLLLTFFSSFLALECAEDEGF